MKKLMFAAAAVVAGVAVADVTSANIVGYTTADGAKADKKMIAMPFLNVGKDSYDIQEIVCKDGDKDPAGEGLFTLSWYEPGNGYQYADYAPFGYADDGEDDGNGSYYDDKWYWLLDLTETMFIRAPLGWKHDASAPETLNDYGKTFGPGEAFFMTSEGAVKNAKITVAGEVPGFDTTKEYLVMDGAKADKQMYSNPFVSSFDIQEIRCFDGDKDPAGEGLFTLSWYEPGNGYQYADYAPFGYADDGMDDGNGTYYDDKWYWLLDLTETMFIRTPLGWKHDASAPETLNDYGKTFAAGEGFYVTSEGANKNPKVGFKNPFYVAPEK